MQPAVETVVEAGKRLVQSQSPYQRGYHAMPVDEYRCQIRGGFAVDRQTDANH